MWFHCLEHASRAACEIALVKFPIFYVLLIQCFLAHLFENVAEIIVYLPFFGLGSAAKDPARKRQKYVDNDGKAEVEQVLVTMSCLVENASKFCCNARYKN